MKQRFQVPDMHCSACVMRLESIEDELLGIIQVTANYCKQQMEIEYDPTQVSLTQIIARVKEHGYKAVPM